MISDSCLLKNKNVTAWVLLVSSLGLHVLDEALTDFLNFFNPLVSGLSDRMGFFPMPAISFGLWLAVLITIVVIGFALTPLVNRGKKFMRILIVVSGIIMIGNGLGHMIGSLYFGRILPGFWSSPLVLAAAVFAVVRGVWGRW